MSGGLEELLDALNETTTLDGVQDAVVGAVERLIQAPAYAMYYLDASGAPLRVRTRGASDSFLSRYEEAGRAVDPVLAQIVAHRRPAHSRGVLKEAAWRAHAFYPVVAFGGFEATMQAPIVVEGDLVGTLDFARRRDEPRFGERDLRIVDGVARRVSDSVARALRFEELGRRSTVAERALDALGVAVLATSLDSKLLFGNRAATRLLGGAGRAPAALPRPLAEALASDRELLVAGRRVTTRTLPLSSLRQALHPLQRTPDGGPAVDVLTVRSVFARDCGAIVSLLYARPEPLRLRVPVLSSREQEIVELVARGLTTGQIAEAASITQNTVKQHLKRIFGKLGVHSRTELVATASAPGADDRA